MPTPTEHPHDRTAAFWDQRFQDRASAAQRDAYYALASPLYQKLGVSPFLSGDGVDWVEWVRRTVCPQQPLERVLVLGCGLGDGLIDFHQRGLATCLHGVDLSETAIERAREAVLAAGLQKETSFEVGDFHSCPIERGAFDAAFMVMSLHHALDLDGVLERVREALKPGGLCVVNEYVGPRRWQYALGQLLLIKAILTLLPRSKRRRPDGPLKGRTGRPTIAWMMETDPSEAAHSDAIPDRFAHYFELQRRIDYGGGIAVPVLDEIVANFDEASRIDMALFKAILRIDRLAWRLRLVPSANAILLGRCPAARSEASRA
ncbi:MAG: class I SAM-dependent methyltransferase [Planctomycetota bacterium]